jgi:Flp pilus assembly pilin Flp
MQAQVCCVVRTRRTDHGTAMNVRRFLRRTRELGKSGATAIEYAVIGVLISIAAFSVMVNVGTSVTNLFQTISNSF